MSSSPERIPQTEAPKSTPLEAYNPNQNSNQFWIEQLWGHFDIDDFAQGRTEEDHTRNQERYGNKKVFVDQLLGFFEQTEQHIIDKYHLSPEQAREFLMRKDIVDIAMRHMQASRDKVKSALWGVDVFEEDSPEPELDKKVQEAISGNATVLMSREEIAQATGKDPCIITQEIKQILPKSNPKIDNPEFQSGLSKIIIMAQEFISADEDEETSISNVVQKRPLRDWRVLLSFTRKLGNEQFFAQVAQSLSQNKIENINDPVRILSLLNSKDIQEKIINHLRGLNSDKSKTLHLTSDPHGLGAFRQHGKKTAQHIRHISQHISQKERVFAQEYEPILKKMDDLLHGFWDRLEIEQIGRSYREMQVLSGNAKSSLLEIRSAIGNFKRILNEKSHQLSPQESKNIQNKIFHLEYTASYIATDILKDVA